MIHLGPAESHGFLRPSSNIWLASCHLGCAEFRDSMHPHPAVLPRAVPCRSRAAELAPKLADHQIQKQEMRSRTGKKRRKQEGEVIY